MIIIAVQININQGVVESLLDCVISKWKVAPRCLVDLSLEQLTY